MNEIKNTLFSFVTMRAPELLDEKLKKKKFVYRDINVIGHFDEAVNAVGSQSKWDKMLNACGSTFDSLLINSEEELSILLPELYDFSIWLARNKTDYELIDLEKWLSITPKLTNALLVSRLWDNLFYQVITQKNFYVKETIIQILVANNFLIHYNPSDALFVSDLMSAKVVLPKLLFVEETVSATISARKEGDAPAEPSYPDLIMRNLQIIALENLNINRYNILLNELVLVEKKYRKEYDVEYKKQKKTYDDNNKATWDNYYKALDDAKNSWCAIRDPKIPYDPNNPCDQPPYVALPSVAPFEFDFREEMDIPFLKENLTYESFENLMELLALSDQLIAAKSGDTPLTGSIPNFSSFTDLDGEVNNAISNATDAVYNATVVDAPTYTSYGGVVVPMATPTVNPFTFTLCYKKISNANVNFDLIFDVPDSSWQVVNFHCTATNTAGSNNTNGSPDSFPKSPINQKITITNIFGSGFTLVNLRELDKLTGVITFANGCKKTFTTNGDFISSCVTGNLEGDCNKGNPPTSIKDDAVSYAPKGFGYKQLGIADYKIVEQTVHCYVEGEVAHIENVMARERREKSTRRLLKTETTISEKSESEKEKTTDTSTTERFEMQSEVAQVIQQSKDFNASTDFHVNGGNWSLNAGMGMATHSAKEQNTRQAITNAKEVVQKATERITNKITKERIQKITEEFEENNIHEFDNRKGDKHVVGVYRWVDKIYKNQIVNFGKRLTFEFMVPEPAKLHKLGMQSEGSTQPIVSSALLIVEPIDPRKYNINNTTITSLNLGDFTKIKDTTLKYWAGVYNVEFKPKPAAKIWAGKSISLKNEGGDDYVEVPLGYHLVSYRVKSFERGGGSQGNSGYMLNGKGNYTNQIEGSWPTYNPDYPNQTIYVNSKLYQGKVPVAALFANASAGYVQFDLEFDLNDVYLKEWQQETFKAIIDKYEEAKAAFDEKMGQQKEIAIENKETNPAFFRQMMNLILRKNCISYLIDQTPDVKRTYGKDMSNKKSAFSDYEVKVDENLDDYGAFVMFIEQAFEWSIMSYYFYPYYWAGRAAWKNMYQFDASDDPLFRSFMQSGMARVVVTVRPGFEEAVRFYMQTGKIWNGGEVPVIEDKLFISIVEELREPAGKKEGKAWATRVPTSLTILQANSIGLEVKKALPCNCEDLSDFENPDEVPCGDAFELTTAQINGATGTAKLFGVINGADGATARVTLKTSDGLLHDATNTDVNGEWTLKNIPAGNYTLCLDSTDVFPDTDYTITGDKEQEIALLVNEILEVNIIVAPL